MPDDSPDSEASPGQTDLSDASRANPDDPGTPPDAPAGVTRVSTDIPGDEEFDSELVADLGTAIKKADILGAASYLDDFEFSLITQHSDSSELMAAAKTYAESLTPEDVGLADAAARAEAKGEEMDELDTDTDDAEESETAPADDADDEDDDEDSYGLGPDEDPATLSETGLLDDDDEFPWESEAVVTEATQLGEEKILKFRYKATPFEIHEPEDQQQFENRLGMLEGIQDADEGRQRAMAEKYVRRLASDCLTVDGTPIEQVYVVQHNGKRHIVKETASTDWANHDQAKPLWRACTWYDRMRLGRRMDEFLNGDEQFRPRRA